MQFNQNDFTNEVKPQVLLEYLWKPGYLPHNAGFMNAYKPYAMWERALQKKVSLTASFSHMFTSGPDTGNEVGVDVYSDGTYQYWYTLTRENGYGSEKWQKTTYAPPEFSEDLPFKPKDVRWDFDLSYYTLNVLRYPEENMHIALMENRNFRDTVRSLDEPMVGRVFVYNGVGEVKINIPYKRGLNTPLAHRVADFIYQLSYERDSGIERLGSLKAMKDSVRLMFAPFQTDDQLAG